MRLRASLSVAVSLSALVAASAAEAAAPQEDLVRAWLDKVAAGLTVSIGSSSFDPSTQSVVLSDVQIGDVDDNLIAFHLDDLTVEDARLTPTGALAAHAIRGSNYSIDIHFDVAKWFPGLAALETDAVTAAKTVAPAMPAQKPAGTSTQSADGRNASHAGKAPSADSPATSEAPAPDAVAASEPPVVDFAFTAETLLIERPVLPVLPTALPADRPLYEKVFHAADWATGLRADWVEVDNVQLETTGSKDSGDSITTYSMAYLSGVHEGRVERSGVNSFEQKPKDEASPVKSMTIDSTYIIGMDFGAAIEALDPAKYVGGKGDGKARTVYSQYGLNNLAITFDGGTASLGNIEANDVSLRQTDLPVIKLIADAFVDPKAVEKDPFSFVSAILPNYTRLFSVGNFAASTFEVKAGDTFNLSVHQFDANGLDSDGIGAITLRDLSAEAKDAATRTSLSLLTFQDIRFGSLAALLDLGKSASEGGSPSGEAIRKTIVDGSTSIGFIELGTLAVDSPLGSVGLDSLAITSGDHFGTLPQRGDITFTSLSLPVSLLSDEAAITELKAMGYETLDISGGVTLTWNALTGDLNLEDLTVKAVDMGRVSADFHIGGLPLSLIDKPDEIEARLNDATLDSASITYGNGGIVEKAFEVQGKKLNQDGDTFRKNTAGALPLMLTFLDDKVLQERFSGPITDFLNDPKSIRLAVAPRTPIPFSQLEAVNTDKPTDLIKLLNVTVTANQ